VKIFQSEDRKALADAYNSMFLSAAWMDLERYAKAEKEASMKRMDSKAASDLSLGEVCEERGVRKGIQKILQYAQQKGEGI
jgi:hypothetical protein